MFKWLKAVRFRDSHLRPERASVLSYWLKYLFGGFMSRRKRLELERQCAVARSELCRDVPIWVNKDRGVQCDRIGSESDPGDD